MRPTSSEPLTTVATELAWLLGSWALAFVALGGLLGFNRLLNGPLGIQLHHTYFVLSTGYAVFPVFVFVATVVTAARGALAGFRQASSKAVLALLGLLWAFLLFIAYAVGRGAQ